MDENPNACAMAPMALHWDRNEFAILDDADRERNVDHDAYMGEEVVLLRRPRSGADFVQVGHMPRSEAHQIIATAERHDVYAETLEQADQRDRERAEQLRRGFYPRRYDRIGWMRGAQGRERGPKLVLTATPPDDGHEWHEVGTVVEAP